MTPIAREGASTRRTASWRRIPPLVIDLLLVVVATLDAVYSTVEWTPLAVLLIVVACGGLLLRRRLPLLAFALTLPLAAAGQVLAAPMIALYTLATATRRRWLLVACGAVYAVVSAVPWFLFGDPFVTEWLDGSLYTAIAVAFVYQLATAAAPILLGQLVQARHDLARRLLEIEEAHEYERTLHAETVLARERAQLAREMHDVVSHQVSLIAVQSAAMQVTAVTPGQAEAAGTIRALSVTTLDELRTMVSVLRASGSTGPGLAPQPTLAELPALVAASGHELSFACEADGTVAATGPQAQPPAAAVQRAAYRVVQEALTNVRKHAPSARAVVEVAVVDGHLDVTVRNGPPAMPPLGLPGGGVGLVGLRERVELLGGRFSATATADGGFRVQATLPVAARD